MSGTGGGAVGTPFGLGAKDAAELERQLAIEERVCAGAERIHAIYTERGMHDLVRMIYSGMLLSG